MRHILNSLPDGLIDRLINGASRTGLANLIEKRGDVDKQSNLIKGAFASPKIIVGALLSMLGII
jgi:hypothetical protein